MSDREARLRYSGFIMFLSRLLSIGTGLLFTLMVTRGISTRDFGVYGNITDVFSYFILLSSIIPFWTTRFIARKHPGSAITGLVSNLLIALPCMVVFLIVIPIILPAFHFGSEYLAIYTIVSFEIFEIYASVGFEAILQVKRPQVTGYGYLITELCKLFLGFWLIMQLNLGLLGAVASVIIAIVFQLLYYLKLTLPCLHEKFRLDYLKEWVKASPFIFYSLIGNQLASLHLILLVIYGGVSARAYYGAAQTIGITIFYSSYLAYALYPRLLSKYQPEDVHTSLKMVLMFAIPMTVGATLLSDSYLIILNPIYQDARLVLIISSLDYLVLSVASVFHTVVAGTEKLDAGAKIPYGELVRSRMFFSATLSYLQAAISIPLSFLALNFVVKDALDATLYMVVILFSIDIGLITVRYLLARKSISFSVPWTHIGKYVGSSAIMAVILYLVPHPTRLLATLGTTLLGAGLYLLVLSAIDYETRTIFRSAMLEFKILGRTLVKKG